MEIARYEAPDTLDAAVDLLATAGGSARVLAGGTDLLVQLKTGRIGAELVVDLKRIPELTGIEVTPEGFSVGAAASGARIGEHAELAAAWPGVVEAAELIGSTQIQGRASLGGNLCNGSPAADTVPALIAAGAVCRIVGGAGERRVPVEEIVVSPGRTSLAPGEIVAALELPRPPARTGSAYLRFIPRTEMDIAVVGCGVALGLDDTGRIARARVGLGAVAPRPLLVAEAGAALVGRALDDAALADLAAAVRAACNPIDDKRGTVRYRIHVAGVLAQRAARIALERARA